MIPTKPKRVANPPPDLKAAPPLRDDDSIRVMVVDADPLARVALADVIDRQPDMRCVARAPGMAEAVRTAESAAPHVIVADLRLGDGVDLELIRRLHAVLPQIRILALSDKQEILAKLLARISELLGYATKETHPIQLVEGIHAVARGRLWISPDVMGLPPTRSTLQDPASTGAPFNALSDRELQIFELLEEGRSTRETAKALHVSIKTVEICRESIKRKMAT